MGAGSDVIWATRGGCEDNDLHWQCGLPMHDFQAKWEEYRYADRSIPWNDVWMRYFDACGAAPSQGIYSSARAYYELFDGLACDDRITDLTMRLKIGGHQAHYEGALFRVSVYGRSHVNGRNLVTLHQEHIDLPDLTMNEDPERIVATVAASRDPGGIGLVIAHQPDFPRNLSITSDAPLSCAIHFYGTDQAGEYQSETLTFPGYPGTFYGTAVWKHIAGIHQDQAHDPANISVGVGSSLGTAAFWRTVKIDEHDIDEHAVRCVVAKVEQIAPSYYFYEQGGFRHTYDDQIPTADPPPWGIRLLEASVYASPLRRNVTPERVVEDIVSPWWSGERFFCPDSSGVDIDQLVYEDIPKTRLDALLEVDQMLDWDIEATKSTFTYRKPVALGEARDDELYRVSLSDPHMRVTITPAVDECWNGVRVSYANKREKPKEIVLWGESEWLGTKVKTHVYSLPESIRSRMQAQRVAERVLASGLEPPIAGAPRFVKSVPVASGEDRDCLLMRPGELLQVTDAPRTFRRTEREISAVTLRPMTHEAEVELGAKSRKFDKWLARLAAKGKA